MKALIKSLAVTLTASLVSVSAFAADTKPLNLDELLAQLEKGKLAQSAENQSREQAFLAQRAEQEKLLQQATARRDAALKKI